MKRIKLIISSILVLAIALSFSATVSASDGNIILNNVDDPKTVEEIKQLITALDTEDGNITGDIYVVTDNYTGNERILGEFIVVYGVRDSYNQETTVAITVKNVDVTAPVISVDDPGSLKIPQNANLSTNLPSVVAIDGLEGNLTEKLTIQGLSSINTSILGSHVVTYTVSDSSGNTATEQFTVEIVDSTKPTINGPTEIIKKAGTILDSKFFIEYFTAYDDTDGELTHRIRILADEYTGNANSVGNYMVIIGVEDNEGNSQSKTLTIKVVNDMIPTLIIDDYHWVVPNDYKITDADFISVLKGFGDLPNNRFVFTAITDSYSSDYKELGTYEKKFNLLSETGEEFNRSITIEVVDATSNIISSTPTEEGSSINFDGFFAAIPAVLIVGGLGYFFFFKKRKPKRRF